MSQGLVGLRLLQVVGDSDSTHDNQAAVELHRQLGRDGIEVRTLALAPGHVGGLASVLPTMSPSGRSLAAHTQLRREQRWADVVVLRGPAPASAAGLAPLRSAPPTVLLMTEAPDSWRSAPPPTRVLRSARAAGRIVVSVPSDLDLVECLGVASDSATVIPISADVPTATTRAGRAAARRRLGIPDEVVVVLVIADDATTVADLDRTVAEIRSVGLGWTIAARFDDRWVQFGATSEDRRAEVAEASEMAVAAADAVVVAGSDSGGSTSMSPSLIRAMGSGLGVIGAVQPWSIQPWSRQPGPAEAAPGAGGWAFPTLAAAAGAGVPALRAKGLAAAARVRAELSSEVVAPLWHELLGSLLS